MACEVKAAEMTARASTPGTARSMRRPAPREGLLVAESPTRARAGKMMETSSCSPLRSWLPISNEAWARTRRAAVAAGALW